MGGFSARIENIDIAVVDAANSLESVYKALAVSDTQNPLKTMLLGISVKLMYAIAIILKIDVFFRIMDLSLLVLFVK